MSLNIGTLGDVSVNERAEKVDIHFDVKSLPPKQRAAYLDVEAYLKANPGSSAYNAARATGHNEATYYLARKRVVASSGEAMREFSDADMIRPGDKILSQNLIEEDPAPAEETPRRRRRAKLESLEMLDKQIDAHIEAHKECTLPVEEESETITEKDVLFNVISQLELLEDNKARARVILASQIFLECQEA